MPDEFARLKQEARGGFGYAVNRCEFLWNDSEKVGVIDSSAYRICEICELRNQKRRDRSRTFSLPSEI
jgi:hypothetical protein